MPRGYSHNFELCCYSDSFPGWSGETAGFDQFVFDSLTGQYASCRLGVFLHDADLEPDGTPKKPHCHVWLHTKNAVSPAKVAKRCGLSEKKRVTPEPGHTEAGFVPYCTHAKKPEEAQYPADRAILTDDFASASGEKGECLTDEADWSLKLFSVVQVCINRGIRNTPYVMSELYKALPASARGWAARQMWQIDRKLKSATYEDRGPVYRFGSIQSMPDSSTAEQLQARVDAFEASLVATSDASSCVPAASDVLPASDASAASLAAPAASESVPAASDVLPASDASVASLAAPVASEGVPAASDVLPASDASAASLSAPAASECVPAASDVLPGSDVSFVSFSAPVASEGVSDDSDVLPPMTPEEIAAACASGRCSLPECDLASTGPAFDKADGVDTVPGGKDARDRVYRDIDRLVFDIRRLEELSRIYQCSPISASAVASCGQWLVDSLSTLSGIAGTSGSAVKTEGGGGLPPFTPLIVPPADRG